MEMTVNGTDVHPAESECLDWVTKVSKRLVDLHYSQQQEFDGTTRAASTSVGCEKESRTAPAGCSGDKHGVSGRPSYKVAGKKHVERPVAPHLPRLPNADHKVIIRSKSVIGGAVRM
ncbi:hypothetical protein MRX96_022269 [Rhipicephalus microplus]